MTSFKCEVQTVSCRDTDWTSNALRFATAEEADRYGVDLAMRWTAVRDIRTVESDDPVNYVIENDVVRRLDKKGE